MPIHYCHTAGYVRDDLKMVKINRPIQAAQNKPVWRNKTCTARTLKGLRNYCYCYYTACCDTNNCCRVNCFHLPGGTLPTLLHLSTHPVCNLYFQSYVSVASWCRGPEQIVRGDQAGGRQNKQGRPMSGGATDRGRKVLTGLMSEGLGDQVLLLRIYQACPACNQLVALLCGSVS